MTSRSQQQEYLASIAQAFDVGDYEYLSPDKLQSLDQLIANGWKTLKQGGDIDTCISQIQQATGR
jgi:hypothetical protein